MKIFTINYYYKTQVKRPQASKKQTIVPLKSNGSASIPSVYARGAHQIAFGENLIQDYLYDKSLVKHIHAAKEINPANVEDYFRVQGIPCDFKRGSEKSRKVVAYGCFNAAEVLRQINMILPTKIDMEELEPGVIAACYYTPYLQKGYPIRTVTFNTDYDWDNHIERFKEYNKKNGGFLSSGHFLQSFLHEFGHNIHNHHLYSKFGCPFPNQGYRYNPAAMKIIEALNMPIYDPKTGEVNRNNQYITDDVRNIIKKSSGYGSRLLPETFAEEFARTLINCMDPMSLRLTKNPLPIITSSPDLNAVLYETWEGLVADNEGYVK